MAFRWIPVLAMVAIVVCTGAASAASNGINRLMGVSQMKASTANDKAMRATTSPVSTKVVKPSAPIKALAATKNQSSTAIKNAPASGDVSMERQQRLQMYLEPYNQTQQMISNIQKKSSETSSSIIGNVK